MVSQVPSILDDSLMSPGQDHDCIRASINSAYRETLICQCSLYTLSFLFPENLFELAQKWEF